MIKRVSVIRDDITRIHADIIVNAANSGLMGGGGVDGAIHRAGGNSILNECKLIISRIGACPAGDAVITGAGDLNAKYIIHTVGPVWHSGSKSEEVKLGSCYRKCLAIAAEKRVESIAFPNISTGIYRYPKEAAAKVAFAEVIKHLSENKYPEKVYFVCYDSENYDIYKRILQSF